MCENCIHFIYDNSTGTCDCAKCDELTEKDVECFVNDTPGCSCFEEYDGKAEYDYYKSIGVIL